MALAVKTARFALGRTVIDAQFLADSVLFMNSKYGMQRYGIGHFFITFFSTKKIHQLNSQINNKLNNVNKLNEKKEQWRWRHPKAPRHHTRDTPRNELRN